MSYSKRIAQVAGHLNFPKGLLAGQTAIITGSGQGIGAEAARLFANEGAKVVVSDIDGSESCACSYLALISFFLYFSFSGLGRYADSIAVG